MAELLLEETSGRCVHAHRSLRARAGRPGVEGPTDPLFTDHKDPCAVSIHLDLTNAFEWPKSGL